MCPAYSGPLTSAPRPPPPTVLRARSQLRLMVLLWARVALCGASEVQSITLTGQVNRTGLMCTTGQRCLPSTDVTKNNCICDANFAWAGRCKWLGCCTALRNGNLCSVCQPDRASLRSGRGTMQWLWNQQNLSCTTTTGQCSCNCPGRCCDSNGTCQAGTEPSLCGTETRRAATARPSNKSCISQTCQ